mgnify:CR=1 FL=1
MTTTDTDALTERLWEAVAEVRDQHPRVFNDAPTDDVIAAVLPIIAVEVRTAKAEAWDEGQEAGYRNAEAKRPYDEMWTSEVPILIDNPYRRQEAAMSADEYEAIPEAEWKVLATTEIPHLTDEEKDYLPSAWDEWIARVRRDAAREALDGLYEDASQDYRIGLQGDDQERMNAAEAVLRATYAWMDHYPKETP